MTFIALRMQIRVAGERDASPSTLAKTNRYATRLKQLPSRRNYNLIAQYVISRYITFSPIGSTRSQNNSDN